MKPKSHPLMDGQNDFGDNLTPPVADASTEKRVRIVLEDNDNIAPGGQFVSYDGKPFMLQPGFEIDVPVGVLNVLDQAVMSVPVVDASKTVIGYRDRLRMPYRVVRHAGE